MSNPYIRIHRTIAGHRGWPWQRLIPVGAAVAALPMIRDTWFSYLPQDPAVPLEVYASALSVSVARIASLVAAVVILATYSALVRGPDRAVLDVHPIRARLLVTAIGRMTLRSQLYVVALAGVMMVPIGQTAGLPVYAASLLLVIGAFLGALGVGFAVHLGSVWAAYSPRLAAVLDALRGDNPPMQAALIYAPGVALLAVGLGVEFGSMGLQAWLEGASLGLAWMAIPPALGALAWAVVGSLASRFYVQASLLLAEVDGAWASASQAEHAEPVYLQHLAKDRPELLRALRNGWRSQRLFATGGWALGALVALGAWSEPSNAVFWGAGAIVWVTAVGPRMAAVDPPWLSEALGVQRTAVVGARVAVSLAYGMGVVAPVGGVLVFRHGAAGLIVGAALAGLAVVTACCGAWISEAWRRHAQWGYSAIALVAWAGFVRMVG
ncbi:MAG: hypothetical protein VX127_11105 [Myxococcota bacterium]|nr:hypothetical protein [Myxococcota bacterium]